MSRQPSKSYAGVELVDGLSSHAISGHGEITLAGKDEADCMLDIADRERVPLDDADEMGRLEGNHLKLIADEGVHDSHGFLAETGLRVHLLEGTVDVDFVSHGSLSLVGSPLGLEGSLLNGVLTDCGSFLSLFHFSDTN